MSKVALVTDSTTYLPQEYVDKYHINVIPVVMIWSGRELRDGVDIQPDEFYTRLESAAEMPTTSQPTPDAARRVFDDLLTQGYDILGIFISQKLSGTYDSAVQAQRMLPGKKIEVIDSHTGSMGAGWPILAAARAAMEGASLEKCKSLALQGLQNVGILLSLETLEFLHRGGRIGRAQRFLGAALNLKPILEVVDGEFIPLERVRTRRKSLERLVELMEERLGGRRPVHLGVLHANARQTAEQLLEKAAARVEPIETLISHVSPAVGAHLGPGTVGVAFMTGSYD
jgi:DegV family protein with EDD domain